MKPSHSPTPSVGTTLQGPKPYQTPTLVNLGAVHSMTATKCDKGYSDSGPVSKPPSGGGGHCDWC